LLKFWQFFTNNLLQILINFPFKKLTNKSWSLANLRFWVNLEKQLCRKQYLDSVLLCKRNEDEKWKEQSYEEDDSAAASYTPMNSLELTTTNLSFQALTVWCWSFLNPDTNSRFQTATNGKTTNSSQQLVLLML
jgi:hypothetical protein